MLNSNSFDQIASDQFELQKRLLNRPLLKVQGYKFNRHHEHKLERKSTIGDNYKSLMQLSSQNKRVI